MTKSYQEWHFFLNPDSLNEQGQATMWSTTRCSTWLKYLYSASTFFEDWKVLKANLRKKKCEKETLMEKPGILGAQLRCLKEEQMEIFSDVAYDDLEGLS